MGSDVPRNNEREQELILATYLDIHDIPGVKADDVVGAHEADLRVQAQYGVDYKHYWVDEESGQGLLPR